MTETDPTDTSLTRRTVLRSTAGAAAAATGIGAASTASGEEVALQSLADCQGPSAPADYPYVDGDTGTVHGEFPTSTDELTLFVNGYMASELNWPGQDQGYLASTAAQDNGYTPSAINSDAPYSVAAWAWESAGVWSRNKRKAERQGRKLADWIQNDYRPDNPDTCVRLVGHSLGARVVASCLRAIDANGWETLRSTALLGGAIDDQSVATDGQWGPYIASATDRCNNYYKTDDQVLDDAYAPREGSDAVGQVGAVGTPPDNYADHDVTGEVESHCTYFKPGNAMDVVVANWSFPCGSSC